MSEVVRLYRYRSLLSSRRAVSAEDLMATLEVSRATLKRDIAKLRDQLHVPILFNRDLGGYRTASAGPDYHAMATPSVWRTRDRTLAAAKVHARATGGMDDFYIPAFLRNQVDSSDVMPVITPAELLDALNDVALKAKDFGEALKEVLTQEIGKDVVKLVETVTKEAGNRETAWALLIDWLMIQLTGQCSLNRHAQRLLRYQLGSVDEIVKLKAAKRFAGELPGLSSKAWGTVPTTLLNKINNGLKRIRQFAE